jgi:hypothetical protein
MLTENEAIAAASREFTKHGYVAGDYDIKAETNPSNQEWWTVWFDLKGLSPIPGGKHAVLVNKRTGRAEFLPGE